MLFTNLIPADSGIFESYIILNNGSNQYYNAQSLSGNPDFNGTNLGVFNIGDTYLLNGGEVKTYKNSGSNITGAYLYYRIYKTGDTQSFIEINLPYNSELGNDDQKWDEINSSINILSGLTAGDYTLEVYLKATSSDGDYFSNNGDANYKATFTVKNVTVTPAFPSRSEQVTVTLDVTGTALDRATKVYLHSGVG